MIPAILTAMALIYPAHVAHIGDEAETGGENEAGMMRMEFEDGCVLLAHGSELGDFTYGDVYRWTVAGWVWSYNAEIESHKILDAEYEAAKGK